MLLRRELCLVHFSRSKVKVLPSSESMTAVFLKLTSFRVCPLNDIEEDELLGRNPVFEDP